MGRMAGSEIHTICVKVGARVYAPCEARCDGRDEAGVQDPNQQWRAVHASSR